MNTANKLQQLTSYKQVSVGDTIICNTAHSSRRLLTKGKAYKVLAIEPNTSTPIGQDYVTVQSDKPNRTVTAYITRFSRQIERPCKPDTAEVITIIHAGETYTLTELVTQEWKIQTTDGIYTHYTNLAEAMHMVTRFIKETIRMKGTI